MKKIKNYSVFEVSGLNYETLLNKLLTYNINAKNIQKSSDNKLILTVENKNVKKLIAVTNGSCYNINRINNYGMQTTMKYCLTHVGAVIAFILCLALMFVNSQLISSVNITGLNKINRSAIQQILSRNNVGVHCYKNSINTKNIETELLTNLSDLTTASVCVKGTTLQINVKERIYVDILDGNTSDIVATSDCIITSLTVTQGTPLYKVGDNVKAGSVIVAGYKINESGEKVALKAVAKVEVNCFISSKIEVGNTITELQRNGNKISKTFYYFNNQKLFNLNYVCPYQFYQTEEKTEQMFNMFPFYAKTVTYYECESITKQFDFEQQKESLKKQVQYETYEKISENDEIISENFYVTQQNDFNVIVFTLKLKKILS